MKRRDFLRAGAFATAAAVQPSSEAVGQARAAKERPRGLRVISYNVLACRGYPETDANRERLSRARENMAARFALELDLYQPDIVTFQESPSEEMVASIALHMGMNYAFFPGGWPGSDEWPGGFPGTIMTRFPILEKENCPMVDGKRPLVLFSRHWCRALLKTENGELSVYSAHLHPSDGGTREREVTEILRVLDPELKSGKSLLFQGDLNHGPDGPEYARWAKAGLVDTFAAKGTDDHLTIPSTVPRARIDFIWAHGPITERLTESRVLFEGGFRTNPDDATSFALSDHVPVLACFE